MIEVVRNTPDAKPQRELLDFFGLKKRLAMRSGGGGGGGEFLSRISLI
jgi:hypothetical protein